MRTYICLKVHKQRINMDSTAGTEDVVKADHHVAHTNEELSDADDHRCGYRECRPAKIQVFNNAKCLLVLLCSFSFIQSMVVNGLNSVNASSYERRFGLTSSQVGLISSCYDISAGILVLPITYCGLRGHKTVLLSVALALHALGSLVMLLPHVTTGPYEWGQFSSLLCDPANKSTATCPETVPSSTYFYVFIVGQLLHGAGGTTLYSVGICCLDDNVIAKSSPVYVAILFVFAALGPAAGYMLGGYFLTKYVDFNIIDEVPLESTDPRWVGAWWIGFVISMALSIIVVIPLLCFPRELPGAKATRATRVSEAHQSGTDDTTQLSPFIGSCKELHKVLWSIVKNPAFIFVTLAATSTAIVSGFTIFLPKFIENQYTQTTSTAAFLAGLMAVPAAVFGQLLGGYICQCFQLKIRGMLYFAMASSLLSTLAAAGFWMQCDANKTAGVNTMYMNKTMTIVESNLTSSCNAGCGCTLGNYSPVCGADGIQYFSSCHAGCHENNKATYIHCSCINETFSGTNQTHSAENGTCESSCSVLYLFLPILFFAILLTMMTGTPSMMATLRCVPDVHKTFALGVQFVFVRFLGTVPGQILVGAAIDHACVIWKDGYDEDDTTSCWIYNNDIMARNMFLLFVGVKLLAAILYFVASLLYKAPPLGKIENVILEESLTDTVLSTENIINPVENDAKFGIDNPPLTPD